jgi:hypothetical protein
MFDKNGAFVVMRLEQVSFTSGSYYYMTQDKC